MAAGLVAVALATAAQTACSLTDVFAAAGVGNVRFAWASDTVLRVDQAAPIRVTVRVDGNVIENPRIEITVSDTSILTMNAAVDSVVGRRPGRGAVLVRLLTSLTVGQPADTSFEIRVIGGGPPPQ